MKRKSRIHKWNKVIEKMRNPRKCYSFTWTENVKMIIIKELTLLSCEEGFYGKIFYYCK